MSRQQLTRIQGRAVAETMLAGFNKHYRLYREVTARAKGLFETRDWRGIQDLVAERIQMYAQRVHCVCGRAASIRAARSAKARWAGAVLAEAGSLKPCAPCSCCCCGWTAQLWRWSAQCSGRPWAPGRLPWGWPQVEPSVWPPPWHLRDWPRRGLALARAWRRSRVFWLGWLWFPVPPWRGQARG